MRLARSLRTRNTLEPAANTVDIVDTEADLPAAGRAVMTSTLGEKGAVRLLAGKITRCENSTTVYENPK